MRSVSQRITSSEFRSACARRLRGKIRSVPSSRRTGEDTCATAELTPAPDVRLRCCLSGHGYELRALIPLSRLAVEPAATAFLIEFQISWIDRSGSPLHKTMFGSSQAYCSADSFARIVVRNN
jgi:hypothetical protein